MYRLCRLPVREGSYSAVKLGDTGDRGQGCKLVRAGQTFDLRLRGMERHVLHVTFQLQVDCLMVWWLIDQLPAAGTDLCRSVHAHAKRPESENRTKLGMQRTEDQVLTAAEHTKSCGNNRRLAEVSFSS